MGLRFKSAQWDVGVDIQQCPEWQGRGWDCRHKINNPGVQRGIGEEAREGKGCQRTKEERGITKSAGTQKGGDRAIVRGSGQS